MAEIADPELKTCTNCKRLLLLSFFGSNKQLPSGRHFWCRACVNTKNRAWVEANKGRAKKSAYRSRTKVYASPSGRARYRIATARQSARRLGVPFDLDRAWLEAKFAVGVCEVTGLPFSWDVAHGVSHKRNAFAPSLDRIVPEKGYTKENTRVVVWIFNRARGAFPDADLMTMARALVKREASC